METKVNSKGQITIPSEIRERLGIKDGTYLHVDVNDAKQIILTPVTRELFGVDIGEATKEHPLKGL